MSNLHEEATGLANDLRRMVFTGLSDWNHCAQTLEKARQWCGTSDSARISLEAYRNTSVGSLTQFLIRLREQNLQYHIDWGPAPVYDHRNMRSGEMLARIASGRDPWLYFPPWWWDAFWNEDHDTPLALVAPGVWRGEVWVKPEKSTAIQGTTHPEFRYVGPDLLAPENMDLLALILEHPLVRLKASGLA